MTSQVQLHSVPLSIVYIPLTAYPLFFHGIVKLLLNAWEDEYRAQLETAAENDDSFETSLDRFEVPSLSRSGSTSSASSRTSLAHPSDTDLQPSLAALPASRPVLSHHKRYSTRSIDFESSNTVQQPQLSERDLRDIEVHAKINGLRQFMSVAITPDECTVICPSELVSIVFGSALASFNSAKATSKAEKARVLKDEYLALQVDGESADSGPKLLELTGPLRAAGFGVFFVPTYFSDYVLVRRSDAVGGGSGVEALLQESGFVYSSSVSAFIATRATTKTPQSPPLTPTATTTTSTQTASTSNPSKSNLFLTGLRTHLHTTTTHLHTSLFLKLITVLSHPPQYLSVSVTDSSSEVSLILRPDALGTLVGEVPVLGAAGEEATVGFIEPLGFGIKSLVEADAESCKRSGTKGQGVRGQLSDANARSHAQKRDADGGVIVVDPGAHEELC